MQNAPGIVRTSADKQPPLLPFDKLNGWHLTCKFPIIMKAVIFFYGIIALLSAVAFGLSRFGTPGPVIATISLILAVFCLARASKSAAATSALRTAKEKHYRNPKVRRAA